MRLILKVFIFVASLSFANSVQAEHDKGLISVSGRGEVMLVPDMATITLGVFATADTAREAVDAMNGDLTKVLANLDAAGISPRDIQTSSLQISPIRDYNSSTRRERITGYSAQSQVHVRILELDGLGIVLDQVVSDGANQMNGLRFDVQDRAPHIEEARRRAVADAMSKAATYADAAGVTLGALKSLSEMGNAPVQMRMEMSVAQDAGMPISAGEISISASVSMSYEVETPAE